MAHLGARFRRVRCFQWCLREAHDYITNQHAFKRALHPPRSLREQQHRLLRRPRPLLRHEPTLQRGHVDPLHTRMTLANSTTQVAILNTSANFMVTALLGMLVFSEGLPLLWWVGAAFLVAGSVTIGLREQKNKNDGAGTGEENGQEDAGAVATVALGTGGVGAGAAIIDSVEHNRYRDSVEGSTGDVELEEEREERC